MENDKLHFKKKNRPLASKMVSKKSAILLMIFLVFIIIFVSIISKISISYILIYIVINILYNNKDFLNKNMYMFLGMKIVFYSLWTINLSGSGNSNNYLVWTVPLIIVIFMRYNLIIEKSNDGDPIEVLFSDKVLLSVIVVYFLILFFIMYII